MIQVPPSRFLAGPQLAWTNPSAAIKDVPWWLVAEDNDACGNPPASVPLIPSFADAQHEFHNVYDGYSL
jgi:hypothetical protein